MLPIGSVGIVVFMGLNSLGSFQILDLQRLLLSSLVLGPRCRGTASREISHADRRPSRTPPGDPRVAATPEAVNNSPRGGGRLQAGAGAGANFRRGYAAAGANIVAAAAALELYIVWCSAQAGN